MHDTGRSRSATRCCRQLMIMRLALVRSDQCAISSFRRLPSKAHSGTSLPADGELRAASVACLPMHSLRSSSTWSGMKSALWPVGRRQSEGACACLCCMVPSLQEPSRVMQNLGTFACLHCRNDSAQLRGGASCNSKTSNCSNDSGPVEAARCFAQCRHLRDRVHTKSVVRVRCWTY